MRRKMRENNFTSNLFSALDTYYPGYAEANAVEPDRRGGTSLSSTGTGEGVQTQTIFKGLKSRNMTSTHWLFRASPYGQITGDFTMCCWVRLTSNSTEKGIISRYEATKEEYILSYNYTPTRCFRWYIYRASTGNHILYDTNIINPANNTWYFLTCGVRNFNPTDGSCQMFLSVLDRPFVTLDVGAGAWSYGTADWRVGRYGASGATGAWDGHIAHVMRFNRAITIQERDFLYNRGMLVPYPFYK